MAEIDLGWNNGRLQAGARGAEAIVRRTSATMKGALKSVEGIDMGRVFAFATGATGFGLGLKAIIDMTAQMDSLKKGLLAIEGTEEGVTKRLEELKEVAALPGLGMAEAIQGDIRLRAVGLSADLSRRALVEMGNALAIVGGGKAELDGVLLALTQIVSKGKVSAEEINQIAERVPQIRRVLKDAFGTADTEQLQKMGISVENFVETVIGEFSKGQRATGGLRNSMETLMDSWNATVVAFGEPFAAELIPQLAVLQHYLEVNESGFRKIGQTVGLFAAALSEMLKTTTAVGGGLAAMASGEGFTDEFHRQMEDMEKAAQATAAATKDALKPGGGSTGTSSPSGGSPAVIDAAKEATEAARTHRQIEDERLKLAERQFDVMLSNLTPALQLAAIHKRIRDLQAEAAGAFGPVHELERLRIMGQIMDLQRQERSVRETEKQAAERKAEKVAEEAKQAAEVARQRRESLALLDAELQIIEARARGDIRSAEAMERAKRIAEQTLEIMRQTGLSQDEAAARAQRMVDAQAKADRGPQKDGKIHGYSRERQGGAEESRQRAAQRVADSRARYERHSKSDWGGLDGFYKMQDGSLRDTWSFPGLDAHKAAQDRKRPVGAPAPAADGKAGAPQELPTVESLLKQLITATTELKEGG